MQEVFNHFFFLLKQNVLFESSQKESGFSTSLSTKNKSDDHLSEISLTKAPLSGTDGGILCFCVQ